MVFAIAKFWFAALLIACAFVAIASLFVCEVLAGDGDVIE
jgi:hypothetical protein